MSILLQLGYNNETSEPVLTGARLAKANNLIVQLDAIDSALAAARLDSMAVQVDKLTVDYTKHMALLKAEGSRLLKELSNLVGLAISYDRFYGSGSTTVKRSAYTFQSYW